MKICKQCGKEKEETDFSPGQGKCKNCRSQKALKTYKKQNQKEPTIEEKIERQKQKEAIQEKRDAEKAEKGIIAKNKDMQFLRDQGLTEEQISRLHYWSDGSRRLF